MAPEPVKMVCIDPDGKRVEIKGWLTGNVVHGKGFDQQTGTILAKGTFDRYTGDFLQGTVFNNGIRHAEGRRARDVFQGKMFFDDGVTVESEGMYVHNVLVKGKSYDKSGRLLWEGRYEKDEFIGKKYMDGKLKFEGRWTQTAFEGKRFAPDGTSIYADGSFKRHHKLNKLIMTQGQRYDWQGRLYMDGCFWGNQNVFMGKIFPIPNVVSIGTFVNNTGLFMGKMLINGVVILRGTYRFLSYENSLEECVRTATKVDCDPRCARCGKLPTGGKRFAKCAGCLCVRYCSVKCRDDDWQTHKKSHDKTATHVFFMPLS